MRNHGLLEYSSSRGAIQCQQGNTSRENIMILLWIIIIKHSRLGRVIKFYEVFIILLLWFRFMLLLHYMFVIKFFESGVVLQGRYIIKRLLHTVTYQILNIYQIRRCWIWRFIQSRQEISDEAEGRVGYSWRDWINLHIRQIAESNKCFIVHPLIIFSSNNKINNQH